MPLVQPSVPAPPQAPEMVAASFSASLLCVGTSGPPDCDAGSHSLVHFAGGFCSEKLECLVEFLSREAEEPPDTAAPSGLQSEEPATGKAKSVSFTEEAKDKTATKQEADKTTQKDDGAPPKAPQPASTDAPSGTPGSEDASNTDTKQTGGADAKPKTASQHTAPTSPSVTPQSLLQEVQAVHKTLKNFAGAGTPADVSKLASEVEGLRKDCLDGASILGSQRQGHQGHGGRITALEQVVGAANAHVCTMSSNLDVASESTESYLKECLKSLATMGGAAKTFHADTQVLIAAKRDNLKHGAKTCINKATGCDYEAHQSLSKTLGDLCKQTYDLGQEPLAALHHAQGEQSTTKDNLWQIANVLSDTVEQVKVIRDYCERPVPVSVQIPAQSPPMPPPAYEPSIHGARQQLHLQTAIPMARGSNAPPGQY